MSKVVTLTHYFTESSQKLDRKKSIIFNKCTQDNNQISEKLDIFYNLQIQGTNLISAHKNKCSPS